MPRKKKVVTPEQKTQQENPTTVASPEKQPAGFRWTESYTSLFLGISVVIVGILFFVVIARTQNTKQVTSTAISIIPTIHPSTIGTITEKPTPQPTKEPTRTPTPEPTKKLTLEPTKIITPEITKQPQPEEKKIISGKQQTYTVAAGDDLWHIAEKFYKSGYNYVDIAKTNNLENPSIVYSGTKLIIPQVTSTPTTVTVAPAPLPAPSQTTAQKGVIISTDQPIKTSTYTIQPNDDLWNIAVRAYNDGYKWTDIAKANNLTNPGLIHVGNTIKIPR